MPALNHQTQEHEEIVPGAITHLGQVINKILAPLTRKAEHGGAWSCRRAAVWEKEGGEDSVELSQKWLLFEEGAHNPTALIYTPVSSDFS